MYSRLELVLENQVKLLANLSIDKNQQENDDTQNNNILYKNHKLSLVLLQEKEHNIDNPTYDHPDSQNIPSLQHIRNTISILLNDLVVLNKQALSHNDPDYSLLLDLNDLQVYLDEFDLYYKNLVELINENGKDSDIDTILPNNDTNLPLDSIDLINYNSLLLAYNNDQNNPTVHSGASKNSDTLIKLRKLKSIENSLNNNINKLQSMIEKNQKLLIEIITPKIDQLAEEYTENFVKPYNSQIIKIWHKIYNRIILNLQLVEHFKYLNDLIVRDNDTLSSSLIKIDVNDIKKLFYIKEFIIMRQQVIKDEIAVLKKNTNPLINQQNNWQKCLAVVINLEHRILKILKSSTDSPANNNNIENENQLLVDSFQVCLKKLELIIQNSKDNNEIIVKFIENEYNAISLAYKSFLKK
ncbi:Atg23p SCDLUD_004318 [Saccharomycodes ludwigii]|uniref:Atg23p n=1 Tax=Saccharomycodes ludwigii TaxID=36035 RepID=UPI001E87F560|nr:hypothetical protein SCDLUD_004318 [Saccharomycodes ludwigii]KAH3900001.1 hypothetical protein SCDLUD_004318 [Saccharomycodes ludwigii]